MVPHMYVWPPHVQSDGPPYLIWNRYCMVPPHVQYDFFRAASKESTVCPTKEYLAANDENYISFSTPELTECNNTGH